MFFRQAHRESSVLIAPQWQAHSLHKMTKEGMVATGFTSDTSAAGGLDSIKFELQAVDSVGSHQWY